MKAFIDRYITATYQAVLGLQNFENKRKVTRDIVTGHVSTVILIVLFLILLGVTDVLEGGLKSTRVIRPIYILGGFFLIYYFLVVRPIGVYVKKRIKSGLLDSSSGKAGSRSRRVLFRLYVMAFPLIALVTFAVLANAIAKG